MDKKIKHTNKLIRDNIPQTIEAKGAKYQMRQLNQQEFELELKKKLIEEAKEVLAEQDDLVGELADALELIETIAQTSGIALDILNKRKKQKKEKNGGFEKRLFLEWVEEN